MATGLVLPSVHAKAAFEVDRAAFFGVFAGDFGESAPEFDIDEGGFLAFFAAVEGVGPVDGQADIRDSAALGGEFDFGIAGDVSDKDDFIDVGHDRGWMV